MFQKFDENNPLQQLPHEIDFTKNALLMRNTKIAETARNLKKMMIEVQNRNRVLHTYANNLVQLKNNTEKEKSVFDQEFHNQMTQFDNEFSQYDFMFQQSCRKSENIRSRIQSNQKLQKNYLQNINNFEKTLRDLQIQLDTAVKLPEPKPKCNFRRLQQQIEHILILSSETENHCDQYKEYIRSLCKDLNFYQMSKQLMLQRELQLGQQIISNQTSFNSIKSELIQEIQNQKKKQDEYMQQYNAFKYKTITNIDDMMHFDGNHLLNRKLDAMNNEVTSSHQPSKSYIYSIIDEIESVRNMKTQVIGSLNKTKCDINNQNELIRQLTLKIKHYQNDYMMKEYPYLSSMIKRMGCLRNQLKTELKNWESSVVSSFTSINFLTSWKDFLDSYIS